MPSSFTPDGAQLVFAESTPAGGAEIRVVQVESGADQLRAGEPQSLLKTATIEVYPSFSPDGRWLAYADAEGGTYEVYVRAFPCRVRKRLAEPRNCGVQPAFVVDQSPVGP
jgi:Tol biopolymer transport system component